MPVLDYVVDPFLSEEDQQHARDFYDALNHLMDTGKIRMEIDEDGEPRFYPVTRA